MKKILKFIRRFVLADLLITVVVLGCDFYPDNHLDLLDTEEINAKIEIIKNGTFILAQN